MRTTPFIRVLAVTLCVHGGRVLVERGEERSTGRRFHRAIGGGVEFGERAADTVVREWQEEYALSLADVRPLGVVENLFTYEGTPGHEIVLVFAARIVEPWVYERDTFAHVEANGLRHEAVWHPVDALDDDEAPVYPAGLRALLDP